MLLLLFKNNVAGFWERRAESCGSWQQADGPIPWAPFVHFSLIVSPPCGRLQFAWVGNRSSAAQLSQTKHNRPAHCQTAPGEETKRCLCVLVSGCSCAAHSIRFRIIYKRSAVCAREPTLHAKICTAQMRECNHHYRRRRGEGGGWTCRVPGHSKIVWEWSGCSKQWSARRNATMQPHRWCILAVQFLPLQCTPQKVS